MNNKSIVQAVLFRKVDWKLADAMIWLGNHHFKIKKVDITKNWLRFRIHEPLDLKNKGYTNYANKFIENESIIFVIAFK